jgi:hypothetical protein
MAEEKADRADRYTAGTGGADTDTKAAEKDDMRPGVTGGGRTYLPETGRARAEGTGADQAEGTIGAVGEMDITGAPAGPGGGGSGGSGETQGGGPGGGAASSGGTGPASGDEGPQSIANTVAALNDREPSNETGSAGGPDAGAGNRGATGESNKR